jgi:hypothetical protein
MDTLRQLQSVTPPAENRKHAPPPRRPSFSASSIGVRYQYDVVAVVFVPRSSSDVGSTLATAAVISYVLRKKCVPRSTSMGERKETRDTPSVACAPFSIL